MMGPEGHIQEYGNVLPAFGRSLFGGRRASSNNDHGYLVLIVARAEVADL